MDVVASVISLIGAIPKLIALIRTIYREIKGYSERVALEKKRAIEKKRLGDNLEKAKTPEERKNAHDDILNS